MEVVLQIMIKQDSDVIAMWSVQYWKLRYEWAWKVRKGKSEWFRLLRSDQLDKELINEITIDGDKIYSK